MHRIVRTQGTWIVASCRRRCSTLTTQIGPHPEQDIFGLALDFEPTGRQLLAARVAI